jgi:hypothetical protein
MPAKSDPRDEEARAGSRFYIRRPFRAGDLLPALGLGLAAGLAAFYVTQVLRRRTPLDPNGTRPRLQQLKQLKRKHRPPGG